MENVVVEGMAGLDFSAVITALTSAVTPAQIITLMDLLALVLCMYLCGLVLEKSLRFSVLLLWAVELLSSYVVASGVLIPLVTTLLLFF